MSEMEKQVRKRHDGICKISKSVHFHKTSFQNLPLQMLRPLPFQNWGYDCFLFKNFSLLCSWFSNFDPSVLLCLCLPQKRLCWWKSRVFPLKFRKYGDLQCVTISKMRKNSNSNRVKGIMKFRQRFRWRGELPSWGGDSAFWWPQKWLLPFRKYGLFSIRFN